MRGAAGVLLVGKRLQLPQVHHGFDHHLQRAHTMGPAPARALGGVGGDLADDSVLEKGGTGKRCLGERRFFIEKDMNK